MKVPKMTDIYRRRIYVAGPMRGIPAFNYPKFNEAEKALTENGWIVINPAKIGEEFGTPEQINDDNALLEKVIKKELLVADNCDAFFLLKGWEKSKGARKEVELAIVNGADIYVEETNDTKLAKYVRYTMNEAEANLLIEKDRFDRYSGADKLANEQAEIAKRDLDELTAIVTAEKEYVGGAK